jgi:DGQHR domain-containing protein
MPKKKKASEGRFRYPAIETDQRPDVRKAPKTLLFSAPAGQIEQWANVSRLGHDGDGIQRRKNNAKVAAVARFLNKDARNTIPAAITVALRNVEVETGDCEQKFVRIRGLDQGGDGLIIDGQHRLFGVCVHDPEMPLNVVAILDPDDVEIAFQFLVINNKSSKVPTDHIKLLTVGFDDGELQTRLQTARMVYKTANLVVLVDQSDDSPFYHSITWPVDDHRKEQDRHDLVTPTAIEMSLNYLSSKNLPGLEDSDDARLAFFFAVWRAVKDEWSELWIAKSKLLSKVGVVTMTQFLVDDLTPLIDRETLRTDEVGDVEAEVKSVISDISTEFWTEKWRLSSLDTSAGRQIVLESLQRARRNGRRGLPWREGTTLFSPTDGEDVDPVA